jgi:Zn-dependent protease/CBS domain-containing protein
LSGIWDLRGVYLPDVLILKKKRFFMLSGSWQIGKIYDIPLRLHFSWFVVFGLITWALATQYFPQVAPELPQATNWLRGIAASLLLFLSVVIHELSHSFVARYHKIQIASITLFIFGGVAQIKKEPSDPKIELRMALAGPFSSYLLAIVFLLIFNLAADFPSIRGIAFYLFQINLILATFNLIPGFPMDGGRVLRAFLWKKSGDYLSATQKASKAGQAIALFFIFSGIFSLLAGYGGSIWFILIGWFLYTAAQSHYQQAATRGALTGVRVRDVMVDDIVTVDSAIPVWELVNNYFLLHGYGSFPVMEGDRVVGIVSLKEVKGLPRERWADTKAKDIMQVFDSSFMVSEDDYVSEILERMVQEDKGRFLALRNRELVGLITRSGIARYLRIKRELA